MMRGGGDDGVFDPRLLMVMMTDVKCIVLWPASLFL